jgi:hypothetical protein
MYGSEELLIGREQQPTSQSHPDMDMDVEISVYDPENIFIFHDKPFRDELSWVEYDVASGRIDFIMNDGDLRNFGILIKDDVGQYLRDIHTICVALVDEDDVLSDVELPLVTHH